MNTSMDSKVFWYLFVFDKEHGWNLLSEPVVEACDVEHAEYLFRLVYPTVNEKYEKVRYLPSVPVADVSALPIVCAKHVDEILSVADLPQKDIVCAKQEVDQLITRIRYLESKVEIMRQRAPQNITYQVIAALKHLLTGLDKQFGKVEKKTNGLDPILIQERLDAKTILAKIKN
jgi:hypothetical protein